ncbi:adenosine deaminase [Legionella taurinensis]|uniref:Adenosine deaminase n=1 Tax=Legionella taurinensis TaxID=70611 RepID=A0AB38N119_9GAMM|nr:adenosine deaminase [Legionella taurinensis]MDX1838662.1 adenosine deaminase [Legionella taurinensis]PUT38830.1 adenosine deaminase [Legionella taurinensis]PUT40172.1 adenosine deaminase [Legionella taurinensis]PUT42478.1 adenosine deaminase [Legionella taurinensis]PUT45898.1 adenosine deaminase [Legionella taurinensis]
MTIKKAELHVHLEGTISPQLAQKLANRNQLQLPAGLINANGTSYNYGDFMDFLKAYDQIAALIASPQDYYDVTFEYLKDSALGGGIYTEMMYSPDHAEMVSGIPSSEHLKAIQQAIDDAEHQHGIVGRIIITAVRHFGEEAAVKVAKQGIKEDLPCIVGFGLGGDEVNYPPKRFAEAYQIAVDGGLHATVHAGEFASADGMNEAMDYLPIKRIGHGVQSIHSPETIARLKDNQIALEICPSSNVRLGLFKDIPNHPIRRLQDAGLMLSINSDDPPFFNTNLANEYERVQQTFHYSDKDMLHFTRMALETAFVDETTRKRLLQHLN